MQCAAASSSDSSLLSRNSNGRGTAGESVSATRPSPRSRRQPGGRGNLERDRRRGRSHSNRGPYCPLSVTTPLALAHHLYNSVSLDLSRYSAKRVSVDVSVLPQSHLNRVLNCLPSSIPSSVQTLGQGPWPKAVSMNAVIWPTSNRVPNSLLSRMVRVAVVRQFHQFALLHDFQFSLGDTKAFEADCPRSQHC
jgi:hypothetical protein